MNKAEFAVCRIKEKLPGNQGLLTKGSGCVVHCERLTTSWGWKCHYFIVTPSVVLCHEDLSSDKTFVLEFLSKDKRGVETFEVKQMADVCKDLTGRSLEEDFGRDHCLSFLSVEPLDKRGFLKKMVKKGSLQTFRPLDCVDFHSKSEEESLINEGLFCHVIADLFSESTNFSFSTQTFKLVYESETRQFSLQDFGGAVITFNQEKPPIGAVIFTKKGEFVGVLDFVDNYSVSPVFLPESSMKENSQEEDIPMPSNGVSASAESMSNNDDEHLTEQRTILEEKSHPGSDAFCDENSQAVKISVDDVSHGNNNALPSSGEFPPGVELTSTAKECTANLMSGGITNEVQTEHVLDPVNGTAIARTNFEEFSEEDKSKVRDLEEEGPDKMEDADRVGEFKPVEMESIQQTETLNEDIVESDHLEETSNSDIVPPESDGSIGKEMSDVEEPVVECLPVDEDGQMKDNTDNFVADQENLPTDDSNVCVYTETEPVTLVGSMPENKNTETDSVEKPDAHVTMETSDENSKNDDMTLVAQDDKDVTDSSEETVDKLLDSCDVSIHVTPPNGDIGNETEDYGDLKECHNIQEDVSEDLCETSSSAEVPLSTETTKETEVAERGDSQFNVDNYNKLPETESAQGGSGLASLNLEEVDAEVNTDVMYKGLDEHIETELEQYSPRFDGDEAVVTHKEFVKVADEGIVSAETSETSDHNQNEVDDEKITTAESPELNGETKPEEKSSEDILSSNAGVAEKAIDGQEATAESPELNGETKPEEKSSEDILSSNAGVSEKAIDGQEAGTLIEPAVDVEEAEAVDKEVCGESALDDTIVLQRVDADSLLTETVTNNPLILRDLGKCLDTEYQYGRVPCWRDLAELLDIPPEAYEHCGTFSATSPTEDLFVFLTATKPQLTIQDIKEALNEIDRHDVAQLLDRRIAGGIISKESVVGSLVERDDTDILGRLALKLDRKRKNDWKGLALQLSVPHRVLRNFGSNQRHNSSLMLLKYIPIFDPELTLEHLKACLFSIGRQDAVKVLDSAGIPGDEPVKGILDDSELLDQITDLLNEDPPSPHWRHLAKELKIPKEKCKIFEPTEDTNSPTKLLFKSIEKCEPDLTFEELVLALVAMKRQDVLDVLQKYFSSDDIDQILEENNLLAPVEDHPEENES
ncbi:uncharacterized protein LOC144634708 isoform X2 [Oculina patagonica]